MSAASDLIERMEAETGHRIDDNEGNNAAMTGLFGAVSRMMGQSPPTYREEDDVAAGLLIRHRMTPEYEQKKESDALMVEMFLGSLGVED